MLEFAIKGGPVMIPIFLCSFISFMIILEKLYQFYKADVQKFIEEIKIKFKDLNGEEKEKMITKVGSLELQRLEKNLGSLAVIAHISPLLGLLGTVTGMIKAFMKIQALGGRVDASVLAGGIWEALITTAAGLSVAIPTLVAYYYFEGKVDGFEKEMRRIWSLKEEKR